MNRNRKIITSILTILAIVPLINFIVLAANNLYFNMTAKMGMEKLGQMGDFFGGHTAAFSGLLSVVLIIYFSSEQDRRQQEQFEKQLLISKQTADLASLSNIYSHYGETYGAEAKQKEILQSIASGHRRWAIRESFSIIDPNGALESKRVKQVASDHKELLGLLKTQEATTFRIDRVSELTSSLLIDKRLQESFRADLWDLYELLRADEHYIHIQGTFPNKSLDSIRVRIIESWERHQIVNNKSAIT